VPAPAEEVDLRQVGDRLRLRWKAPSKNEDGTSESVDLDEARVMRRILSIPVTPPPPVEEAPAPSEAPSPKEAPPPAPPPAPFRSDAVEVSRIESSTLGEPRVYEEAIDPAWIGKRVEYGVLYENRKGRESPLSAVARIDPVAALAPPGAPKAESGDGLVALTWSAPEGSPASIGFSVHRRLESSESYSEAPLNSEPLSAPSFEDRTAVFGAKSCYVVAAVLSVQTPSISSVPSEEVCITPLDQFPPPAPSGLVAVSGTEAILLSWRGVDAPDRKGYRVYRGASLEGPFQFVAEVKESTYQDKEAAPGERLFYYVTAIDDSPQTNESPPSEVVEATRNP
jgi:hypothetical protein